MPEQRTNTDLFAEVVYAKWRGRRPLPLWNQLPLSERDRWCAAVLTGVDWLFANCIAAVEVIEGIS